MSTIPSQVPSPRPTYLTLDLSPEGPTAQALLGHVVDESGSKDILLTDIVGKLVPNITPKMDDWYQNHIQPLRSPALQRISQLYEQNTDHKRGHDVFLPEKKQAEREEDLLQQKLKCYKAVAGRLRMTVGEISRLEQEKADKAKEYNAVKQGMPGGRDAKPLNWPLYLSVLIFVIFGSEAAINLDAFKALSWATPAIAWGSTILVGLAIGVAAHFHGELLKQYHHWFGPARKPTYRRQAQRMFHAGNVLLSVALSYVYYARYAYFTSQAILDPYGEHSQSLVWIVGGSVLGNLLVYMVGTLWAFMMHDTDPDYTRLKARLEVINRRLRMLESTLHGAMREEVEPIVARSEEERERLENAAKTFMTLRPLQGASEVFEAFKAQDERVVGLLSRYRSMLIQRMGPHAAGVVFMQFLDDPYREKKQIKASDFLAMTIKVKLLCGAHNTRPT